jgi:MFS family permease
MAYRVLAVCTGFNVVSRGVAESFAVFLLPLSITFDASRAETTLAYSSFMLVLGLCSPLTGWAVDRFGPRRVYQTAMLVCLAGTQPNHDLCVDWAIAALWGIGDGYHRSLKFGEPLV